MLGGIIGPIVFILLVILIGLVIACRWYDKCDLIPVNLADMIKKPTTVMTEAPPEAAV